MNTENQIRAERILCAATAVEAYNDNKDDPATIAADLLADLRHFCDLHGLPFEEMDTRGREAYLDEIEEPTA
jgi:hypothetical protein